ncbi:MAG: NADH-quinone oxidoreductase subunit C [Chloroflexi bacterium]|nr:NADH-quinone oxidoreductase subunit C [Chloroflexota bacterium]
MPEDAKNTEETTEELVEETVALIPQVEAAREVLEPLSTSTTASGTKLLYVAVSLDQLNEATEAIVGSGLGYLISITPVDLGVEENQFEVLYHFGVGPGVVTIRITIPRDEPVIPSVCEQVPSATYYERELMEMFGIDVTDTPNRTRLYLPDQWPQGIYPMRKDYVPRSERQLPESKKDKV